MTTVLDLGPQPVADDLFDSAREAGAAPRHRLAVGCCEACGLVQLDPATPVLPNAAHGHGSAFSGTVLEHERIWTAELLRLPSLPPRARVLDVSGGGGLLRGFAEAGHAVHGGDGGPEPVTAGTFDLVLANHSLSHADDLDAAVAGCAAALAPSGTLAVEFHSAEGIVGGGQFDVICHAHRSYLSLTALSGVLARHGLTVTDARALPLHGGVVRLLARRASRLSRPTTARGGSWRPRPPAGRRPTGGVGGGRRARLPGPHAAARRSSASTSRPAGRSPAYGAPEPGEHAAELLRPGRATGAVDRRPLAGQAGPLPPRRRRRRS